MIEELAQYDDFRAEVRQWCAARVPTDWRERQNGVDHEGYLAFQREWRATLAEGGYLVPHWPVAWGGSDMPLAQQIVLYEELARADAPRADLTKVAIYNAAPPIFAAGTEEQKLRFLPGMVEQDVWCQGFSEPNAGSDLAALTTRADRDGDTYVVNGQKIWTSLAADADYCILLARTDHDAPRHRGLSLFVMDMTSPGVEVRPIVNAIGRGEFCETFLTDVAIPADNLIGEENDGWAIGQTTLASERAVVLTTISELVRRQGRDHMLEVVGEWTMPDGSRAIDDGGVRETLGGLYGEVEILRLLLNRMVENLLRSGGVGAESSVIKIYYSELLQRLMRVAVELEGLDAQLERPFNPSSSQASHNHIIDFIMSFGWTIGGGTNEIMRNLVAEQVLGLPREPKV